MASAIQTLQREIADLPVIDTHEHLRPPRDLRPMSVTRLFTESYVKLLVRASDGSRNALGSLLEIPLEDDTWETVEAVINRVRLTSFYRWLMKGLVSLYDLPGPELTRDSWSTLTEELRRRHEDETWLGTVLDRANIRAILWDPFWHPGTCDLPERRFRPSLRINSSLVAFHPEALDFEGNNVIRDWAASFNMSVDTLSDLEALIDRLIDRNVQAGARSLKSAIAYERTLRVDASPRDAAERIFGTHPSQVTEGERKLFGDYIIRFYLDRARERGLVVQVHTGLARLDGSHPLLLEPLIAEFPGVVFDLFHGGYPWFHDVAALAYAYPNVRLNLVWLPQISTEAAVTALKAWIQLVPQIDRISWGGDCRTPEETYGSLLAARYAVARALGELVDDEYLTMDLALVAARSILATGGARIYGLDDPLAPAGKPSPEPVAGAARGRI